MPGYDSDSFLNRPRQQARRHRRQGGDGDQAAPMREQLVGARGDRFDVEQDALERHQQIAAGLRQRDMPLAAIEQFDADRGLELLNLHRERRLRHVQLGRRAGEAAGAGEGEKRAYVAQVVDHGDRTVLLLSLLITEIRTIQLSNREGRFTVIGLR